MIVEEILQSELTNLNHVHQFQTQPILKSVSVAQHSYWVALYALVLHDQLFQMTDRETVLALALVHDLEEVVSGDINTVFKHRDPDMLQSLQVNAGQALRELLYHDHVEEPLVGWYDLWEDSANEGEGYWKEHLVVKLADLMAATQTLITEIKLGNSNLALRARNVFLPRVLDLGYKYQVREEDIYKQASEVITDIRQTLMHVLFAHGYVL